MSLEHSPGIEKTHFVDLSNVPPWASEPCSLVSEPLSEGAKLDVSITATNATIPLPSEAFEHRQTLEGHAEPGKFFDGLFPGVLDIEVTRQGKVHVEVGITGNFDYVAAAYTFRDAEGENPIRPLAVQVVPVSPDGSRLVLEHRMHSLDHPHTRNAFGGALKSGETDPVATMIERLSGKWKREDEPYVPGLAADQFQATGVCRDNITNVYCITYALRLTEAQYEHARVFAEAAVLQDSQHARERVIYEIETTNAPDKLREFWRWEPITFANTLYALSAGGHVTSDDVRALLDEARAYYLQHPRAYTYPMERYLGKRP